VVNGEPRSLTKTNGDRAVALEPSQRPKLVAKQRVRAAGAILDPPDMQHGGVELDLVPAQVAHLGRPKPVAVGEQDHGCIPVPVPIALGGLDQHLDLARRQVLSAPKLGVRAPGRRDCSIYFGWRYQPQRRLCHDELRTACKRETLK
jgi:hypothetical protein